MQIRSEKMTRECNLEITELIGKTLTEIKINDDKDMVEFFCETGETYSMYHSQGCCESVEIEDICGELDNLIGSPILKASEDTNSEDNPEGVDKETIKYQESFTWTFYNIATIKGHVTIRWYGKSNGYYSEEVSFQRDK
jgi:hypothetical protein